MLTSPRTRVPFLFAQWLLENFEHAHGANGRSLSIVSEVVLTQPPTPLSAQAVAAAAKAQPELPLMQYLADWDPSIFQGPKLDFGAGMGGGSRRRMAMTQLIGQKKVKKQRRSGVKSARQAVRKMDESEIDKLASARGREMGEAASMPLSSPPRLSSLRNSPRPAPPHAHLARASAACPRTSARLTDSRIVASRSPHALMTSQAKWRRTDSKRF